MKDGEPKALSRRDFLKMCASGLEAMAFLAVPGTAIAVDMVDPIRDVEVGSREVDQRYDAKIGFAGSEVVERLLNSPYVYYGDREEFSKSDMKPLAINVGGRDCNLVVLNNAWTEKAMYVEYPDRRGSAIWIRLLNEQGFTTDSLGNEVEMIEWKWDMDTKPWTENWDVLSYPKNQYYWYEQDAEIVFYGGPIPEAPSLPLRGAVVKANEVDYRVVDILTG